MSDDAPDFYQVAQAIIAEASPGSPDRFKKSPEATLAAHLETMWEQGSFSDRARRNFEQPAGSLIFRTAPRTNDGVERLWIVMADEEPTKDGLPPWIPFQMSFGDRALMRALAGEMIARLDAVEALEQESQARERAAQQGET